MKAITRITIIIEYGAKYVIFPKLNLSDGSRTFTIALFINTLRTSHIKSENKIVTMEIIRPSVMNMVFIFFEV